jgi:sulfate transport system ATP-binding protein
MSIEVKHLSKTFGQYKAIDDVSLKIEDGELVALLGPSGSGKTTLLRIIAGLETPDESPDSEIYFHNELVTGRSVSHRRIGFVFQHYALFRHMTVFENIAFGLRVRPRKDRPTNTAITDKVRHLLSLIQLEGLGDRYPSQLSGGQRQRVALARAIAVKPKVLLLDEPFGALDSKVRQNLRSWLRKLHSELKITSVLVTHDQDEALDVADRVVIMNKARIEQVGAPDEVFHQPATPFVMEFLGQVNVFHCRLRDGKAIAGAMELDYPEYVADREQPAVLYTRPHEVEVHRQSANNAGIAAKVGRVNAAGSSAKINLVAGDGTPLQVDMSLQQLADFGLQPGDDVYVVPKKSRIFAKGHA